MNLLNYQNYFFLILLDDSQRVVVFCIYLVDIYFIMFINLQRDCNHLVYIKLGERTSEHIYHTSECFK